MGELRDRYVAVWRQAWESRREVVAPSRLAHELAFLPANLELIDSPPHPMPLWTARVLVGFILFVVLIAGVGELDIVAIAPGKLIPVDNVKIIQPASSAVVHQILVKNGDRVSAGQLLVDLDPTQALADLDKVERLELDAQLTTALSQALLAAQAHNSNPKVAPVPGATAERQADTQSLATGTFQEYQEKLGAMRAELQVRRAERVTVGEEIAKLRKTLPLVEQQASDYEALAQDKYVSTHEYLEKKRIAIEQAHGLAAQLSRTRELGSAIESQRRDIEGAVATFRKEQWERLNKADQDIAQYRDEETKAQSRQQLLQLKSPVNGIVQELNVHTVGGVVTGAQMIMKIVPDDNLEVEAQVSNKDIGFVQAGQSAAIKIATFPYARFGYLSGKVIKVANDATPDKKSGLVFAARLRISSNTFRVDNRYISLSPGMEVTAEIKTGKQKVWHYFLSPLIETGKDSLKER